MVFEHIEKLKSEFTDKYVVVDKNRAELRRFAGQTGIVRTVNMSGRALVEFDAHDNIGWYDIDVDFLKIIDAPLPKEEKPATPAKPKGAATAKQKSSPSPPATKGGGMSVAEMLAAARGEKGGGGKATAKPAAAKPAAAKPAAAKPAAGTGGDPTKMSVEQMLAAARGEKHGAAAAAPSSEPEAAAPEPAVEASPPAEEPASPVPAEAGPLPTETDGIVAWCRQRDG